MFKLGPPAKKVAHSWLKGLVESYSSIIHVYVCVVLYCFYIPNQRVCAFYHAGMMVGGYFWGTLADNLGRRKVVIYSLALNGVFGAASAFARAYWLLLVLRFISGVG